MRYITTPIYYVNDKPHIGHVYTNVCCDVLTRFWESTGEEVFFLTGTDEHGMKIERSAKRANVDISDFIEEKFQSFVAMNKLYAINYNRFIRTSEKKHTECVQKFWNKINENGFIYKGKYKGWYAERDETFYKESELIEGKAPTGAPVEWIEEDCYFFRLSYFQEKLKDLYKKNSDLITPRVYLEEITGFLKKPLEDFCISRKNLKSGIKVPHDQDFYIYVWFDALVNYLTACDYPDLDHKWENTNHFIGKDITRFHCIYWPAMLMAANLSIPKINIHGWWLVKKEKMSKSLGNVIKPEMLAIDYGVDEIRYYLTREISFGHDGDFSEARVKERIQNDLVKDLGNLIYRVLCLIQQKLSGIRPLFKKGHENKIDFHNLSEELKEKMNKNLFSAYLEQIWQEIKRTNQYINHHEPWKIQDKDKIEKILATCFYNIACIVTALTPYMPLKMTLIIKQMGFENLTIQNLQNELEKSCQKKLPKPVIIFSPRGKN